MQIRVDSGWQGSAVLLYATIFHFLAGGITGFIFKARTLLLLLVFVAVESVIVAVAESRIPIVWAVAALVAVQVGYIVGICARGLLERSGYLAGHRRIRRIQVWLAGVISRQHNSRD